METIPFALPFTGAEEAAAVLRTLHSGWLTTGGETLAFEKEFLEFLTQPPGNNQPGSPAPPELHCMAVNSATSGLHLALEACGVRGGDLVLVPSYTFTSTAEVVRYLGADPVFVDVRPGTFHMDPAALEQTLGRLPEGKAKAVIPVHFGGLPCGMEAILEIARKYTLKVIEDAAHSFPSFIAEGGPRWAGTIGDAGVFSFYATKTITTGEGGMVVCKDEAIAHRISIMRSHGIDRNVWNRYTDTGASWYYEVVEAGYKYNMPDLLAAVGRAQLSRAADLLRMRLEIAAAYDAAFQDDSRFVIPPTGPGDARHLYPLRLNPQQAAVSRDECIQRLKARGIGVSVHFIPLHIMPFYQKRYSLAEDDFPETMKSFRQEISLPVWPGMSAAQVRRVIAEVRASA
ncbi:MAG: DegT/DnrJ/EryC1/StrS family aminotransferase [Treponema sp.]|nr:DegT/DnrJ/EryC1/StrS family aminotransferase [Treponema sp.]